jgi:hypothetical protein
MKPFTISKSGRTIQAGSFTIKIESAPCAASAGVEKQIEEHRRLLVQILAASPLMYRALSRIHDNITRWLATKQPAGPEESLAIYEDIAAALEAAGNPTDLLQRVNEYAERQRQSPERQQPPPRTGPNR